MMAEMVRLYQVQVDLVPERFGCPRVFHAAFIAGKNTSSERIENGGGAYDDIDHLSERLVTCYGYMLRLDIALTDKTVTRMEAQQNTVENLLLVVVGRVVT